MKPESTPTPLEEDGEQKTLYLFLFSYSNIIVCLFSTIDDSLDAQAIPFVKISSEPSLQPPAHPLTDPSQVLSPVIFPGRLLGLTASNIIYD